MPYFTFKPPIHGKSDEDAGRDLAKAVDEIEQFCKQHDVTLDAQGFMYSWTGGTRVFVEREGDESGAIKTLAAVAMGVKWNDSRNTASFLILCGADTAGMRSFVKQVAAAQGATCIIYEGGQQTQADGIIHHTVIEEPL